jgi:transcriptional regulator with XRE-family HTH domain
MPENITISLAANIKAFREERGISQQQLADSIFMLRPTVSNWENGKSEPSATQLISMAKALNVSLDALAGSGREPKRAVVVDTSVLIKRPTIMEELTQKFDEVLVPHIVVSELNGLKDGDRSNKQRAWLAMANLQKMIDAGAVIYKGSPKKDGIPDEKILSVAIERARSSLGDKVYMFSDDVYFSYLVKEADITNLEALTFPLYAEKFFEETVFDQIRSQEFFSLVKTRKLENVKSFDTRGVDVNLIDAESGLTPLIQAIRNRQQIMVEYLVGIPGVSLDKPDRAKYCFTPLLHAAQLKSDAFEVFKLLIEKGADCEMGGIGKNMSNTPLMVCAWGGFRQGAEYLLQQGVCVNQQDSNGFTALIKACIKDHFDIGLLLAPLTDAAIRSHENKRAEDYIKQINDPSAKRLVEAIREKRKKDAEL